MANESAGSVASAGDAAAGIPGTQTATALTTADALKAALGDAILDVNTRLGEVAVTVDTRKIVEVCRWLRDERAFVLLSDLTAQDCAAGEPRFYVIYHVRSLVHGELIRLRAGVSSKKGRLPSVTGVWPGANFYEREVYDLFGIEFEGHPNLRRILMPEEWEGHPLRKDYPLVYEPVAFTHNVREIHSRKPFAEG
ncbi:MAG: NADH-quinone oxidoreductase subunit C [Ardenticatenaceae bacterium]|nr:NADH-quinone oxidoreductase subunit C [Ardenticatenaceae bacterium]HBY98563.1 NADH-quinone oxidoreductase subunit C [Chloroflexota bacterium]